MSPCVLNTQRHSMRDTPGLFGGTVGTGSFHSCNLDISAGLRDDDRSRKFTIQSSPGDQISKTHDAGDRHQRGGIQRSDEPTHRATNMTEGFGSNTPSADYPPTTRTHTHSFPVTLIIFQPAHTTRIPDGTTAAAPDQTLGWKSIAVTAITLKRAVGVLGQQSYPQCARAVVPSKPPPRHG